MRHLRLAATLALLFATGRAQQPVVAKAFLPDGHDTILFADLAALRDRGIQEDLEASAVKLIFSQAEKELGFPLANLDRATVVVVAPATGGMNSAPLRLVVFEGNQLLGMPERVARGRYEKEAVGANVLWRNAHSTSAVFAQPQPNVQVMGHEDFIVPVLEGKRGPGMPSSDVMSLMSGRRESVAYAVVGLADERARNEVLAPLFPETTWSEGDAPTHLLLSLRCVGEADDPHLEVEFVLRHRQAGAGLVTTEAAVEQWIAMLRRDPQWLSLRSLLPRLQKHTDRSDLCLSLDLGRTRVAVGHIAAFLGGMLLARTEVVQAQAAAVPVPAAPLPQLEPPKKQ